MASGEASGEVATGAPDMNAMGTAAINISDDGLTQDAESASVTVEVAEGGVISENLISGVKLTSDANEAGGISVTGGDVTIGGEEDFFDVTTHFTGEDLSFNTVVDLDEVEGYDWSSNSSGGAGISVKGGTVTLDNVYALDTGLSRYTLSLGGGTTVVKDSYFESVGADAQWSDMPWFTAQLGNSRNVIACGTLVAYIYNTTAVSEGYGSWSTDTGGQSFTFYLYNGDSINWYGGYGTYADQGLTVFVYGSRFDSAEYGVFVTNTGELTIGSSEDALTAQDEGFLENLQGEELEEDTPSEIIGARNAVVFHVVDTMHQANPDTGVKDSAVSTTWQTLPQLTVTNSTLSTVGATNDPVQKYPVLQQAWMDHLTGSTIVFRGASADCYLTNVELESSNGILIQSVVDLDESTIQILDDVATEDIHGSCVYSVDNNWTGNISNEDYQRPMNLDFVNTTLTGAIYTKGLDDWNALFADYADVSYVVDETTGWYVNADDPTDTCESYKAVDPTAIYGWLCPFTEYNAVRGTYLTLDETSVWNVTDESLLMGLTTAPGAVINGTVTVDGVVVDVTAGGSWTGEIVVTPAEGAASGEAAAPAAGGTDEASYQEYLKDFVASCEDIQSSGAADEFIALIDAGDYSTFPVEMLFDATWFGEAAMTYDQFVAAGGVATVADHPSNGAMLDGTG
jgi:hypothetical protein